MKASPAFSAELLDGVTPPQIIAHRGYSSHYPENTLLALHQAIKCGACFVEFDVQFSADGTPVLFHDDTLDRTTGLNGEILNLPYNEIKTLQACEPNRFGRRFVNSGIGIPTLRDAVYLIKNNPQINVFVELKTESLKKFGIERVAKTVVNELQPIIEQCIVISYDSLAIRCARAMGAQRIGWVLTTWDQESRSLSTTLAPDYLFSNVEKIPFPIEKLWPGPWQWAIYDIDRPELAMLLAALGADLIESKNIEKLLRHPYLHKVSCLDGYGL